jgi:nitroreductase
MTVHCHNDLGTSITQGEWRVASKTSDLFSVMHAQRACRSFDPDGEVSDADVEAMLEAAVHAPSAENSQPWVFVVVRDPSMRAKIADLWTTAWSMGGSEQIRATATPSLFQDLERGIAGGGFAAAPVLVVMGVDSRLVPDIYAPSSIFPAAQNLLLAANALGYGSCLTTGLTTFFADQVTEYLELPAEVPPAAVIYVGRPARPLSPPARRPARQATHRERFGAAW